MIAKLPDSLCWLSESVILPAGMRGLTLYLRNEGEPLIMDAIYVDAPGRPSVRSVCFNRAENVLPAPVPVHAIKEIGRPRLLPILVFRGGRAILPTQHLTLTLDSPDDFGQTVDVLIRCREVYP